MNPRAWSLFGVMSMLACSSDEGPANGNGAPQDAAAAPDAAEQCLVPEGPYGATVRQSFPRMQLTDCVTEEPYVLYDEAEYCAARVTFVSVAAGW